MTDDTTIADLLEGCDQALTARPLALGVSLLSWKSEKASARVSLPMGRVRYASRWTACFRQREPFWMIPKAGVEHSAIPPETQMVLFERGDGRLVLLAPLATGSMRFALRGGANGLTIIGHTGDPWTQTDSSPACLVAVGDDPFELWREAAAALKAALPEVGLSRDVSRPKTADWFGWCTWDAFYQEVDHAKVISGLESFRRAGVQPRWMILDDGWLTIKKMATGEQRLGGFGADAKKFPEGLSSLVAATKKDFGIKEFWVWHAFVGYWGGAAPGLGVRIQESLRRLDAAIASNPPDNADWMDIGWGDVVGMVEPEDAATFYDAFHAQLAAAGIDGVKVDNQASVEGTSHGLGGRVRVMRTYRAALEASTGRHFGGGLINCMSCSNDMMYASNSSNCTRTSTDFWPNKPESHGLHLYTNAQVSAWFGEFIHPDWDMFQSAHSAGWFHAAGRAVSGAPVYVCDKPNEHDAGILNALTLSDGSVPRCVENGRPSRDCLFHDPTREPVLLKIVNRNRCGSVVGVFNCRWDQAAAIAGSVSPADLPGNTAGSYVVWQHQAARAEVVAFNSRVPLSLGPLAWDIATIAPLEAGLAVIGLEGKLNAGGAIQAVMRGASAATVDLADGGTLLAWCDGPLKASFNGSPLAVASEGSLHRIKVSAKGACRVEVRWA
ncbi:MAG: Sip1-related alpha-galactosidase [Polyangiaceae bacterium]|nr:Sip1-related alpha-galactosidase [Polyangiaceae bacterium]